MKKAKKVLTEEEWFAYDRAAVSKALIMAKWGIRFAVVLGAVYLILFLFYPQSEDNRAGFVFLFYPFFWLIQGGIFHELKKDSSHVRFFKIVLIPYLLLLIACTIVSYYVAVSAGVRLPQGVTQICMLALLLFHAGTVFILLWAFWLPPKRIFFFFSITFGLFALLVTMIILYICLLTNIFTGFLLVFSLFDPYYFYYIAVAFFCAPMAIYTYVFLLIFQIRISTSVFPMWREAFPNLSDPKGTVDIAPNQEDDIRDGEAKS